VAGPSQAGAKFLAAGALGSAVMMAMPTGTALAAAGPGGTAAVPASLTADVQPAPVVAAQPIQYKAPSPNPWPFNGPPQVIQNQPGDIPTYANGKIAYASPWQPAAGSQSFAVSGIFAPDGYGVYGQYATDPTSQSPGYITIAPVAGAGLNWGAGLVSTPVPGVGVMAITVDGPVTTTFKWNAVTNTITGGVGVDSEPGAFGGRNNPLIGGYPADGPTIGPAVPGYATGFTNGGVISVPLDNPAGTTVTPQMTGWMAGTPAAVVGPYVTFQIPAWSDLASGALRATGAAGYLETGQPVPPELQNGAGQQSAAPAPPTLGGLTADQILALSSAGNLGGVKLPAGATGLAPDAVYMGNDPNTGQPVFCHLGSCPDPGNPAANPNPSAASPAAPDTPPAVTPPTGPGPAPASGSAAGPPSTAPAVQPPQPDAAPAVQPSPPDPAPPSTDPSVPPLTQATPGSAGPQITSTDPTIGVPAPAAGPSPAPSGYARGGVVYAGSFGGGGSGSG
jgi:hypothetical protein